jgi:hypothetical protein
MLTKDEKKSSIADARCTLSGSGKIQKDHNKHFDHDKVIPITDPRCIFDIGTFSRESIREHLGRFIVDRRSLTLFGIDKLGFGFRMNSLRKVLNSD